MKDFDQWFKHQETSIGGLSSTQSQPTTKPKANLQHGIADGEPCYRNGCPGHMVWEKDGDCSCHLSPPCSACCPGITTCDTCRLNEDGL